MATGTDRSDPPEPGLVATLIRRLVAILRASLIPLIAGMLSLTASHALRAPLHIWGLIACLAGVHAAYVFDGLADSGRLRRFWRERRMLWLVAAGLAMLAAVVADGSLLLPLSLLSLLGLLYVPLKKIIPKNLLTAMAWTISIMALSLHGHERDATTLGYAVAMLLILIANANLCDLPDLEADRKHGVLGLTPVLGPRLASRIAGTLAAIGSVIALSLGAWPLAVPGIIFALAGWVAWSAIQRHPQRRWLIDAILLSTGPLTLLDMWRGS